MASLADVTEAYHQQALRCGSITTARQHKCWELVALQVAPWIWTGGSRDCLSLNRCDRPVAKYTRHPETNFFFFAPEKKMGWNWKMILSSKKGVFFWAYFQGDRSCFSCRVVFPIESSWRWGREDLREAPWSLWCSNKAGVLGSRSTSLLAESFQLVLLGCYLFLNQPNT